MPRTTHATTHAPSDRRPTRLHRGVVPTAAALACAAVALPTAAHATATGGFKATVPFSGGRSTDLRVGEPLEFAVKGEKIKEVCWSPAPIQADRCGTGWGAPAHAGTQKFTVTLKSGKTLHESLTIGARATTLPASVDDAGAVSARVVEYKATCTADAYRTVTADGHLKGAGPKSANLEKGDLVAAYYKAGGHAIQAVPYKSPVPGFYFNRCLTRVQ